MRFNRMIDIELIIPIVLIGVLASLVIPKLKGVHRMDQQYQLGSLKMLEDITLDDMLENPIWVNDLSGEGEDDFDETAERPVIGAKEVTYDMIDDFVSVSVLIKFPEIDKFGSANVVENGTLDAVAIWDDGDWVDGRQFFQDKEKAKLEVIPDILDGKDKSFVYDPKTDTAR